MAELQVMQPVTVKGGPLTDWHDLWFSEHKRTGYVAITDFNKQFFYGANDIEKIIKATKGKRKRFISINAFEVDWKEKEFSRSTAALKQIRNIAIDIDQYDLGLSIDEALDEIQVLILKEILPEPNLILVSRGIQLFYTIDKGASPQMSWLASYVTEQLISKLQLIGADSNAKDMSRVMRVPNSINERNNAIVTPSIWNDEPYTLQELQSYCKPLETFETRKKKRSNVIQIPIDKKLALFYTTNHARLTDLRNLIELRENDLTGVRNVLLYMLSYHQSLVLNTQTDVIASIRNAFQDVYSTTDKPMSNREFGMTVKSAYKDAREFFNHFVENGYRIIYKQNDGIKKPYKTSNVIKKLNITEGEQLQMSTLRNAEIARIQDKERKRSERRAAGMKTMQEYNTSRKQQQLERVERLSVLLESNPDATQRQLAELMGVSAGTINNLLKIIDR